MIDRPTHYTRFEGAKWKPVPLHLVVTNPQLLTHEPGQECIWCQGTRVHSFLWKNGDRWDSINGMTKGKLPR